MRTFYLIALLLWIIGGSYYAKNTFCPSDKKNKPSASAIGAAPSKGGCDRTLTFTSGDFEVISAANFMFSPNQHEFKQEPSSALEAALTKVSDYLNDNPEMTVLFEGLYFEKEKNQSEEENIGLARANTIKAWVVEEFGINADQVRLGSQVTENACYNKDTKTISRGAIATLGAQ